MWKLFCVCCFFYVTITMLSWLFFHKKKIFRYCQRRKRKEKHLYKISRTCHVIVSLMLGTLKNFWEKHLKREENEEKLKVVWLQGSSFSLVKFTVSKIDNRNESLSLNEQRVNESRKRIFQKIFQKNFQENFLWKSFVLIEVEKSKLFKKAKMFQYKAMRK